VKPGARPRRRRPARAARDQSESAFASILADLVERVPGARGVALVDVLGETVDYAGRAAPYDLRLAAAHWQIVQNEAIQQPSLGGLRSLFVRASRASYVVHMLPEGYVLVIVLSRSAGFVGWRRAVSACALALAKEAGWAPGDMPFPPWFPLDVLFDGRRRPSSVRVAGRSRPLEILGTQAGGLVGRERGWRVRFDTGVEATLVREPGGACYSDEPFGEVQGDEDESR
jgi:hypothetical protein